MLKQTPETFIYFAWFDKSIIISIHEEKPYYILYILISCYNVVWFV